MAHNVTSFRPPWAFFISAEAVVYSALLHNGVGGVPGFDFPIHGEVLAGKGAVPDVMISLAMPDEGAAVGS